MADETEVTEVPEAPQEEQAIEEAPSPAAESEIKEAEDADVPVVVEAGEASAETTAGDEVSEVAEAAEPPQAEEVTAAEEEATEAPAEIGVAVDELPPPRTDIYYYGTGRRKTASAQVRLYPSKEPQIIVNDKPVDAYFPRSTDVIDLMRPLQVTATEDMFKITIKVRGGGMTGQAGAIRHGIARALTKANPELRPALRQEGSLTRDPRMKERKKPGLKRARKAPQYTKR